jgi:frataxin-like iron-binding protein CyaY
MKRFRPHVDIDARRYARIADKVVKDIEDEIDNALKTAEVIYSFSGTSIDYEWDDESSEGFVVINRGIV